MKIFMTGGTGFIGTGLTRRLTENGHKITLLKRPAENPTPLPEGATYLMGDPTVRGAWQEQVSGHDAVINLAGSPIFGRWNRETKKLLRESRLLTTRHLVEAMAASSERPATLLSTSAVGYYGFHGDEVLAEDAPAGSDFLAILAADWEKEASAAGPLGVRILLCRFGIVLGRGGGALGQMVPLFKSGKGSPLGSGDQWVSWIHEEDLARIYPFLLEVSALEGAVNSTAPHPVRKRELAQSLARALKIPKLRPAVPAFVMKLVLGEFGDVLLKGQRVVPEKLLSAGFAFRFPTIEEALTDIFS